MHRFYVTPDKIQSKTIRITGQDVNHIKKVLRMVPGDELIVCNGQGKDYHCKIDKITEVCIEVHIESMGDTDTGLKTKITLFQGFPKR